jgi:hypothetical protein
LAEEGLDSSYNINTYNESPLHAAIKAYIAQPGDLLEVEVDGYIIDIKHDDLLIEVQTRSFTALKTKLRKLVPNHPLRLVYPISINKWIVRPDNSDDEEARIIRRKSPKQGSPLSLFAELVSIPAFINHPNFSIEVLYTHEEEYRYWVGKRAWRRRGWATDYRKLLDVVGQRIYNHRRDFLELLPENLPEVFTKNELAMYSHCSKRLAGQMAYCLRKMELFHQVGKRGKAHLYQLNPDEI